MKKIGLVVEGGAMRGIFATGVLDRLLEENMNPFDLAVGVSAGATNLAAYLAKMHGRNKKVYTSYSLNKEFINLGKFLLGKHLLDLDWMWHETIRDIRLDLDTIVTSPTDFKIGLTHATTGASLFMTPNTHNLEQMIKASSAVPILYRHPVILDGVPYYDGGLACPIPVKEAIDFGCDEIIIIRSRKEAYTMPQTSTWKYKPFLGAYPEILEVIKNRHQIYNETLAFMNQEGSTGLYQVYPPEDFETSRFTKDLAILEKDYQLGRAQGALLIDHINHLTDF